MRVLIACEESQRVCIEFRKLGHEAYSCDIQECSGGHPEWHIQDDVLNHLNDGWDLIIAHPPCTDLAVSGARHFEKKRESGVQRDSIEFFSKFIDCDCPKICIENPMGIIGGDYIKQWYPEFAYLPKYTQIIQPYEYGDPYRKKTCLWLKGLPPLQPTNIVEPQLVTYVGKTGKVSTFSADYGGGGEGSGKRRSKTYPGIAKAMAEQWGR